MPSSWPAWASAAAALALVARHPASPARRPSPLPASPSIVRADGNLVAAVVPGNRKGRCAEIVLWRVGRDAGDDQDDRECSTTALASTR